MENLNEKEKNLLAYLLKKQLKETHEVLDNYYMEYRELTEESTKKIVGEVIDRTEEQKQMIYNISSKLNLK